MADTARGTAAVASAPPDGYTFAVVFDTHGVNPGLIPNLPFDSKKDLTPIVLIGTAPMVLATFTDSPYKSFADVVAAAKSKGGVSYGSIGSGSLGHLAMALLNKALKNPDIAKRLDTQGIDVVVGSAEEARVFIERQMDIWGKVVQDNNIKAD